MDEVLVANTVPSGACCSATRSMSCFCATTSGMDSNTSSTPCRPCA